MEKVSAIPIIIENECPIKVHGYVVLLDSAMQCHSGAECTLMDFYGHDPQIQKADFIFVK